MNWSDIDFHPPEKILRQFAGLWLLIFVILAGLSFHAGKGGARIASLLLIGAVVGGAGLAAPRLVRPLFVGLIVAGFPVGFLVSRIVLGVVYFLILTPIGLAFRIRGRDALDRKRPHFASYWKPKTKPESSERYLRQF